MSLNPKNMTAPQLLAEVRKHRRLWTGLQGANEARLMAHDAAKEASQLPAPQTAPYVQAHPERIRAVAKAKEYDEVFLKTLREIIRAALD